ncbi:hypothetical protein [uncultured Duncaniella sp.]|uniref:hypothetical protein n=1 Tax=uncultured Duncaniella sp. TaxID=2768039 RepID=UPI00259CB04D|nr:hypothetical protein [uncultured Duncaniella sp.]
MKSRCAINKIVGCFVVLLVGLCGGACSSSTDDSDDEPTVVLSTIAGRWNVTAYQDGTHFIPATNPEYYNFTPDGDFSHVYEHTDDLIDTTTGRYTYDPEKQSIYVDEPRGWNLDITVQFLSDTGGGYTAIFNVKGRTPAQSKVIRVQRL